MDDKKLFNELAKLYEQINAKIIKLKKQQDILNEIVKKLEEK